MMVMQLTLWLFWALSFFDTAPLTVVNFCITLLFYRTIVTRNCCIYMSSINYVALPCSSTEGGIYTTQKNQGSVAKRTDRHSLCGLMWVHPWKEKIIMNQPVRWQQIDKSAQSCSSTVVFKSASHLSLEIIQGLNMVISEGNWYNRSSYAFLELANSVQWNTVCSGMKHKDVCFQLAYVNHRVTHETLVTDLRLLEHPCTF